jgi:hypothetical protein
MGMESDEVLIAPEQFFFPLFLNLAEKSDWKSILIVLKGDKKCFMNGGKVFNRKEKYKIPAKYGLPLQLIEWRELH